MTTKETNLSAEDSHYFGAIKIRLEALYELTQEPRIREQISDEIGWVCEKLGVTGD